MSNQGSSSNNADKTNLGGSNSGNTSSEFRSTDAASSAGRVLLEAQGVTVKSGNAGTQGQTGATGTRTTSGQAGEGVNDHYKK